MSELLDKISQDMSEALKQKDSTRVSILRFLISGVHNAKIAKGRELTDEEVSEEIGKEAKRHKESIEAYRGAGREDLVEKETKELEVLKEYLPEELSEEELEKMVDEAIKQLGASSISEMGKVIGYVVGKAGVSADGAKAAEITRRKLAGNS